MSERANSAADIARERLALDVEIKASEEHLSELKKQRAVLDAQMLEAMDAAGIDSVRLAGQSGFTIQETTPYRATDHDKLREWGLSQPSWRELFKINSNTLQRQVREWAEDNDGQLPPGIEQGQTWRKVRRTAKKAR